MRHFDNREFKRGWHVLVLAIVGLAMAAAMAVQPAAAQFYWSPPDMSTPPLTDEQAAAALKKRGYRVQTQDLGSAAPSVAARAASAISGARIPKSSRSWSRVAVSTNCRGMPMRRQTRGPAASERPAR